MCGIVGAIASRDVVPVLVEGLKRLEYRGYDSAGIAVIDGDVVRRVRRTGRVAEMAGAAEAEGFSSTLGIGHTRWATHGGVTESNAHPHVSHGVALVHNGIIENHEQQRERLVELGYSFESQTDTEVIAHLIHHHLDRGLELLAAVQAATDAVSGFAERYDRAWTAGMAAKLGLGPVDEAGTVRALIDATVRTEVDADAVAEEFRRAMAEATGVARASRMFSRDPGGKSGS